MIVLSLEPDCRTEPRGQKKRLAIVHRGEGEDTEEPGGKRLVLRHAGEVGGWRMEVGEKMSPGLLSESE